MGKQAKEKAFQQYYDDFVELAKLYYIHMSVKTEVDPISRTA